MKFYDIQSSTSSTSTVCSCGVLPTGSVCKCLEKREKKELEKNYLGEDISTEHFYKEQNAQVFVEDVKDIIYEDTFMQRKQVSFQGSLKDKRTSDLFVEFYGKKNAIRDEAAELRLKRRIEKYEREGEQSFREVEEEEPEQEGEYHQKKDKINKSEEISKKEKKYEEHKENKFHINIEGASYEILGDTDGLESLEIKRGEVEKVSLESFREMYSDEITPTIQVLPPDLGTSESTSEKDLSLSGENVVTVTSPASASPTITSSSTKDFTTLLGEDHFRKISLETLVNAFEEICSKEFEEQTGVEKNIKEEKEEKKLDTVTKSKERTGKKVLEKFEGVSLCCMCRCIVPEGLPCCPCGASTVVEVFKKESMEVFIQSEDDISYRIELFEREISPESRHSEVLSEEELEVEVIEKPTKDRSLPPESFYPFSPHVPNEFLESLRPYQLTKEYIDSLKKEPKSIPEECLILLNEAKRQLNLKEGKRHGEKDGEKKLDGEDREEIEEEEEEQEGEKEYEEGSRKGTSYKEKEDVCEKKEEPPIKCFSSDLKLFTPEGVEDWRLTMHTKYKEWFFQGPDIHDDSYYDIAVEDVSEDEYEIDQDLEIFFEK